jgi:signal transduction histidine kinase
MTERRATPGSPTGYTAGPGSVPGTPPIRHETLHESTRTRITRLYFPQHTFIRKEPLGLDAERRHKHERAMLERLRGAPGITQLVEAPSRPGSILMADVGGTSLATLPKPLPVEDLLEVAVGLARAVAGMHHRGVLHRDLSPANILLTRDGSPCLIDFALATPFAEIRPEFTHPTAILGTLAYLAPEQTGRTGRAVDHRADLYALGAILYELATGAPPFGVGDPLRLTHDHLARVPVAPAEVNPFVSRGLSAVIMKLLEKELDNRYQTANGVSHDLQRLRDADADAEVLRVGERDVQLRLLPPSRLVGRDDEVAALEAAFTDAVGGRCRGVLVGGAMGVGKTALVDELRAVVTGADGWCVAGKFDQYRRDLEFDAVYQAFRRIGRMLLAEPDDELAEVRHRILAAVGPNAGLVTSVLPEFETLLGVPPDPGDPSTRQVRLQRAGVEVLRAVVSRKRPLLFFVDDLQWAGRTPLGSVDLLLGEEHIEGLLLVAAYRDDDLDAAHPLTPLLARWRDQPDVQDLYLDNLPASSLEALVAEMLHADPATAAGLAAAINAYTSGNPYETVEVLNALRREGVLTATAAGWRWDTAAAREHLGQAHVAGLLASRVEALPPSSRQMVEAMACLGGRVELRLLQVATAEPAERVDQDLAAALDEGLLVMDPGPREAVRFRHDRMREAVLAGLGAQRRHALQLMMARRLAGVPEWSAVAAEQYLPVVDAVDEATERPLVVELVRRAADQAALIGDHALVTTQLAAALRLVDHGDTATLIELHHGRHAALHGVGRLEEADEEYRRIEALCPTARQRAGGTAVQMKSLTHRNRFAEAVELGQDALRELGIAVPTADRLHDELDGQFGYLYRWLDETDAADDLARPEFTDGTLLAVACLVDAVLPAAYVANPALYAWLSLEALRIWLDHGPGRTLIGPASIAAFAAVALRGDYVAGYRTAQRIVALGEARGYEPETSHARFEFAHLVCWFEPIEVGVDAARRARRGLIAGGDLANAGYTYQTAMQYLGDCAPSLDVYVDEVAEGSAFVGRTGSEQIGQWLDSHRWLAGVLRGESFAAPNEEISTGKYADNPLALCFAHIDHAIAAAILADPDGLKRHTAAAMPLLSAVPGHYPSAVARLLRGLSAAGQARAVEGDERADLLAELDEITRWLAARATHAPDNFLHLLRLLEAERAWAAGDFRAAALGFDAGRREVIARQRPWHRALITEHAARFYLAHGLDQAGFDLLAQCRRDYLMWGATAKVAQLDWAYPTLAPRPDAITGQSGDALAQHGSTVTTGTIDLLGVLSASLALSSETSLHRLHARVAQVLSAMTGATAVHLLLWSDDRQDWLLPTPHGDGGTVPVSGAGEKPAAPVSVLRYVQRIGEPLVVADATADDRFARDPYFADADCCSLLAIPILSRGILRALLLLENRLMRGAFTTERLDAVKLIAGQLAVSLDNAQLYAELAASRARIVATADQTRRQIERDLHDGAQQRLVSLALELRIAQAEMSTGPGELRTRFDRAIEQARSALEELRDLSRGIHPAILTEDGLGSAVREVTGRSPIPVQLHQGVDERLPDQIEISAYYIVAEALTNAAKHSGASAITVTVERDRAHDALCLQIADNGVGGAEFTGGTGLLGLKDRAEALGGRMVLHSPPGSGTNLRVELPLASNGSAASR